MSQEQINVPSIDNIVVVFAAPPHDVMPFFCLQDNLLDSKEAIGADILLEKWKENAEEMIKIEVPIFSMNHHDKDGGDSGVSNFSMCIQNMVLTFEIKDTPPEHMKTRDSEFSLRGQALDLMTLTRHWRFMGAQYNPGRFDSVIMRQRKYDAASLYFNSGKLVLTGCFRPEQALDQAITEEKNLNDILDMEMTIHSPVLQNIVSSGVFPYEICINYMAVMYSSICYKVGKFPGTMIKYPSQFGDRAILVFDSGQICHSGARNPMCIYEDMKKVCKILMNCIATPELRPLDEMCLKTFKNFTRPEQFARETQTLKAAIDRKMKRASATTTDSRPKKKQRTATSGS